MCTVMFFPERDPAKNRSEEETQALVDDLMRRYAAVEFLKKPKNPLFDVSRGFGEYKLRVWFDSACYGNGEPGYYYVRIGYWPPNTSAYVPPLIVEKSKLRPDQVAFMEQRRAET